MSKQKKSRQDFEKKINTKTKSVHIDEISGRYLFREVLEGDLEDLKQLDTNLFSEPYYDNYYTSLVNPKYYAQVVEDKETNRIVGECIAKVKYSKKLEQKTAYILTLGVTYEASHCGIGFNLLKNCVEFYHNEKKINKTTLNVAQLNIRAFTFYKRFGFTILKSIPKYYSGGEMGRAAYKMLYKYKKETENIKNQEIPSTNKVIKFFKKLFTLKRNK
ncbi:n-alpha-acetyltransferase 50 [Anaeramoeba flamelloides]|uniref:N-alpha-acetyltransferase 60 n=1 Tax=Anaeramoeba flamelloides TaxID=1746091 RepID=A0ABQ8YNR0_9EUKA|nr:n-alpha-acetyltransferase 50 [Anaeramoeba flamelloides]